MSPEDLHWVAVTMALMFDKRERQEYLASFSTEAQGEIRDKVEALWRQRRVHRVHPDAPWPELNPSNCLWEDLCENHHTTKPCPPFVVPVDSGEPPRDWIRHARSESPDTAYARKRQRTGKTSDPGN